MTDIGELAAAASAPTEPGEGLRAVAALARLVDDLEALHVEWARSEGWSWRQIAVELGVTKQAVHRKHR